MLLGIRVVGGGLVVLLFSLLEFLFLIPLYVHARKRHVRFSFHVRSYFLRFATWRGKTLSVVASALVPLAMLVIGRYLLGAGAWLVGLFGDGVLAGAVGSLNEIVVSSREPVDVVLYLVACFLVIAPCEELFFRGFMLDVLPWRPPVSILVAAVAFSTYHVVTTLNLFSFLLVTPYYLAWGLVLSALYRGTGGNLLFPVVAHGAYNFILFLI